MSLPPNYFNCRLIADPGLPVEDVGCKPEEWLKRSGDAPGALLIPQLLLMNPYFSREGVPEETCWPIIIDLQGVSEARRAMETAEMLENYGINAALFFPASPSVQTAWTMAMIEQGIRPVIGCLPDCPDFCMEQGGPFHFSAPMMSCDQGVREGAVDFYAVGPRGVMEQFYGFLESAGIENYSLYGRERDDNMDVIAKHPTWHVHLISG